MRIQHQANIPSVRKRYKWKRNLNADGDPLTEPSGSASKRERLEDEDGDAAYGEALPEGMEVDPALLESAHPPDVKVEAAPEEDSEEMLALFQQYPDREPDFLRYIVQLAKHSYIMSEQEALSNELALLQGKERAIRQEKDRVLDEILRIEFGCVRSVSSLRVV